ncbi:MAG: F0F1 ATP synthase subunit B [Cellulosilyticaceae bacterium]
MNSKIIEFSMVTVWDWFFQLGALFLIIFILAKLLFKPVSDLLEKRQAGIAANINDAKNAKNAAATLKSEYEYKIADINAEAGDILKAARAKALAREEEIITAAKAEAEAIKIKAMEDMKLEQERVRAEIKDEMIEVATLMAGKFVATAMDDAKQSELIEEIIGEMGDVQWLN